MDNRYHSALLHLMHLLISADGTIDEHEIRALELVCNRENISSEFFDRFVSTLKGKKDRELFDMAIDKINMCSDDEKLRVFVILYKLAEVDGRVHVKEIKLLLYALRLAKIEFEDVVDHALSAPALL